MVLEYCMSALEEFQFFVHVVQASLLAMRYHHFVKTHLSILVLQALAIHLS